MNKINIEEDIKVIRELTGYFEFFIKTIIEDKRFAEIKEKNGITEQKYKKISFSKAIENILANRERAIEEKEIQEVNYQMLSKDVSNIAKELDLEEDAIIDEIYTAIRILKSKRTDMFKYIDKANKYDALVENMKEKLNEEELPLVIVGGRRNSKTLNYGIKLGRKQALQELIPKEE